MTYTQTLAEIERIALLLKDTQEHRLRKHYKNQLKSLKRKRDEYEVSYYGRKL